MGKQSGQFKDNKKAFLIGLNEIIKEGKPCVVWTNKQLREELNRRVAVGFITKIGPKRIAQLLAILRKYRVFKHTDPGNCREYIFMPCLRKPKS